MSAAERGLVTGMGIISPPGTSIEAFHPAPADGASGISTGPLPQAKQDLGLVLKRQDPRAYRADVIALFERNGKGNYGDFFDWYYCDSAQETPITWLLRKSEDGKLLGLCSVMVRTFRWGKTRLRVGILGNLLVDTESRTSFGGVELVRSAQSLVSQGELDLLLGVPSGRALALALRMGFRRLGIWETYAQIIRSAASLRSRLGRAGTVLSPLVDAWAGLLRLFRSGWIAHLRVIELSARELDRINLETWTSPDDRFVAYHSAVFLRWRFLEKPISEYQILGLIHPQTNEVCGYVVATSDAGRTHVLDCRTDARRLLEADAILNVFWYFKDRSQIYSVDTLQCSPLSKELRHLGFVRLPARSDHKTLSPVGFWRTDHPIAREFDDPSRWDLFPGFNDV